MASFEEILSEVEQDESLRGGGPPPPEGPPPPAGETGDARLLNALLSKPELLSKLPALMQAFKTLTEPLPEEAASRPDSPVELLCALRPYMGESRRRTLETMIRLSRLGDTLRSLQ